MNQAEWRDVHRLFDAEGRRRLSPTLDLEVVKIINETAGGRYMAVRLQAAMRPVAHCF